MNEQPDEAKSTECLRLRVWGVIPAAGTGRRIGGPKALLTLDGHTFVERVIVALQRGGVDGIFVVVNPRIAADVHRLVTGVEIVVNDRPDAEMIESIQIGLDALSTDLRATDGILITPVDQPRVAADSVRRCVTAFRSAPDRIVIASHRERRGHPIVFPATMVDFVQSLPSTVGLNQLARNHSDRVVEVDCDDEGTVADIDTPDDYRRTRHI